MSDVALRFKSFDVIRVLFQRTSDKKGGNYRVEVNFVPHFLKEDRMKFLTSFIVNIAEEGQPPLLQVEAVGDFEIVGEPSKEIYDNYTTISAPSIAFPYLRSFVSTISLQAGMSAIIMPPMGFNSAANAPKPEIKTN